MSPDGVSADESFWEEEPPDEAEATPDKDRGKPPLFLEELAELFGRTPKDRGTLLCSGGVQQGSPSAPAPDHSPRDVDLDMLGASPGRAASKRKSVGHSVNSPTKKTRSSTMEEAVKVMAEKFVERHERAKQTDEEAMKLVSHSLRKDGIAKGTDLFFQALHLCKDGMNRAQFMDLASKESRVAWIKFIWKLLYP